jgi:hypothetical protein
MCGGNDKTVSERLLMQWGEMTAGAFQHHIFDHGGHYYWLESSQGGGETERSDSVGGSSVHSAVRSHENDFLRLLIRCSNPFHILMSEEEEEAAAADDGKNQGDSDDEDQKSAVSSVTFQDSYRSFETLSARQAEEKIASSSRASSRGRGEK